MTFEVRDVGSIAPEDAQDVSRENLAQLPTAELHRELMRLQMRAGMLEVRCTDLIAENHQKRAAITEARQRSLGSASFRD